MTMTGLDYLATMTEAQLQQQVVRLAETYGWKWFHPYYSQRSPSGWPDLVLTRDGLLIFAELKRQNGRATKHQDQWLGELAKVSRTSRNVIVRLWRPSDLPGITKLLESGWKIPVG